MIKATVGCFEETTMTGTLISPLPAEVVKRQNGGAKFMIVLDKVAADVVDLTNITTYMHVLKQSIFLEWATDVDGCGASSVSLCEDEACATLIAPTSAPPPASVTRRLAPAPDP